MALLVFKPLFKPSSVVGFDVRTEIGRGRGSIAKQVTDRPVCSHCKKPGHIVADCYALQVCTHCKKRGHNVSRCYELNGYPAGYTPGDRGSRPTTTSQGLGVARANAAAPLQLFRHLIHPSPLLLRLHMVKFFQ